MFCVARCDLPEDVAKDPYCNYEIAERFMKANDHLGFFSMVYESGNYIKCFQHIFIIERNYSYGVPWGFCILDKIGIVGWGASDETEIQNFLIL